MKAGDVTAAPLLLLIFFFLQLKVRAAVPHLSLPSTPSHLAVTSYDPPGRTLSLTNRLEHYLHFKSSSPRIADTFPTIRGVTALKRTSSAAWNIKREREWCGLFTHLTMVLSGVSTLPPPFQAYLISSLPTTSHPSFLPSCRFPTNHKLCHFPPHNPNHNSYVRHHIAHHCPH
ncbi:hypothetical protein E2C01_021569 [Portunus trituberculatus]|uniref:Uncharacterized protein n=1 Tax=Portunus trituberculatus TaxID=210409 RepID=A0A5B7E5A6_PORTR|nr:hypothetical protein [Portunus trituberculatus]